MNPTGARLWELLAAGHSTAEVTKRLGEEYDVDPARLNTEVRDILKQMAAANLVCEEQQ